jgi:hypothetical protein
MLMRTILPAEFAALDEGDTIPHSVTVGLAAWEAWLSSRLARP